jgi:hypothetical protein
MKIIGVIIIALLGIIVVQLYHLSQRPQQPQQSQQPVSIQAATASAESIAAAMARNGPPVFSFSGGSYAGSGEKLSFANLILVRKGGAVDSPVVYPQSGLTAEIKTVIHHELFDRYEISFSPVQKEFPSTWSFSISYYGQYQARETKNFVATYTPKPAGQDSFSVMEK